MKQVRKDEKKYYQELVQYSRQNLMVFLRKLFFAFGSVWLSSLCILTNFRATISDITYYWQFWLFHRFWKIEVQAKNWILGYYLFNLIEYFNMEGVGRLPGFILSLIRPV